MPQDSTTPEQSAAPTNLTDEPARRRAWDWSLVVSFLLLAGLSWLLVRLVWLPYYFGLFFYLIAGLLVSGIAFRIARTARPLSKVTILTGILSIAVAAGCAALYWEYRDRASSIGEYPRFSAARAAAQTTGQSVSEVERAAVSAFRATLQSEYPPGGPIGYARWATASGEMKLTVKGIEDTVSISHRGWAWPVRTVAGMLLIALGLWFGFESLRSPMPVSVFLVPGEEATDQGD
jgi:hypothetical protein